MSGDEKKSLVVKKSVSFPEDLWQFVEDEAGLYGEKSKVIQEALRQMRDNMKNSAKKDLQKGADQISKAVSKKK